MQILHIEVCRNVQNLHIFFGSGAENFGLCTPEKILDTWGRACFVQFLDKTSPSPSVQKCEFSQDGRRGEVVVRGFLLENRGGMFRETVRSACGKGWFAVTIKARTAKRSAQASSDGDGMLCEACAAFPHTMPRTLRASCGIMRRHVRRGRVASPHLRC